MKSLLFTLILSLFSSSTFALAEGVYTVIVQKQKEKEQSRWSLADWFSTKKKIALMDQWLALNSSTTWAEVILDYGNLGIEETMSDNSSTTKSFTRLGGSFYLKFIGLEYNQYSAANRKKESDFRLNLLLLGSSVQSTHIRGFAGKREYELSDYSQYDQSLYGGSVTLYLASFLGLEYIYTKYRSQESQNSLFKMSAEKNEYGAFIEVSFLRIYYNFIKENTLFKSNLSRVSKKDTGHQMGIKLFF